MEIKEKKNVTIKEKIPLLTQYELNQIDIHIDSLTDEFTKKIVKDKDFAIAQHIIKRKEEKIEKLEDKERILSRLADELKGIKQEDENWNSLCGQLAVWTFAQELLKIINK